MCLTRAAQTHEFTLSRSCARPAFRSFTHSLCHARVPDSRCADSRMHFVTLARPACLGLSPTDSCTHVLTFSRWRARSAWIQDYSSIQGFTFPVSYVWPSQIHREAAFLLSSRSEPASLLDSMACMVALSVPDLAMYACGFRCPGRRYHVSFVNALCVWHPDASGPAANPR